MYSFIISKIDNMMKKTNKQKSNESNRFQPRNQVIHAMVGTRTHVTLHVDHERKAIIDLWGIRSRNGASAVT